MISGVSTTVKKEKIVPVIPKVPAPTPGKSTGFWTKKRKTLKILDLTTEDLEPTDVMKKLTVMVETVSPFCF